ncbi:MAG: FecR family protein [Salinivirgaceae bacterium]|nr:FecR family protein [Salinivirgaceae bacterium]
MENIQGLIVKYLNKECSTKEIEQLNLLLRQSEEDRQLFKQIIKTDRLYRSTNLNIDTINDWKKLQQKLSFKKNKKRSLILYASSIAAILLIGFFGLGIFQSRDVLLKIGWEKVYSDNFQKRIVLSDSTEVWLNKNSHLQYPKHFNKDQRLVRLQGEAYFQVKPNPDKPFIVETKKTLTKVLGTSFNIRAYPDEKSESIQVLTGKVKFSDKNQNTVILKHNMAAEYLKDQRNISSINNIDENILAWKTQKFIFSDKSLEQVMISLQKVYAFKYHFANENMKKQQITTKFQSLQMNEIMELLSESLGFTYQIKNNTIHIN